MRIAKAGPMEWRAHFLVFDVNILSNIFKALLEKYQRVRAVTLGSHMKHVQALLVWETGISA